MRDEILKFIRRELIGPDPVKPHIQENGEEILLNEPPRLRYGAGILFPSPSKDGEGVTYSAADSTTATEEEVIKTNTDENNVESSETIQDNSISSNVGDDFEEEIGLANNFLPSAMGFSCFSKIPKDGFNVQVNIGVYEINDFSYKKDDGTEVQRKAYYRSSLDQLLPISTSDIPLISGTAKEFALVGRDGKKIELVLNIRNRTHGIDPDKSNHLLTFTLINKNKGARENIRNEDCFFQVSFSVSASEECFCPYKLAASKTDQDDEKSNQLLFRKKKTFAVGHGCSPAWVDDDSETVNTITTEAIPSYEIKPIVPNELKSVALKMFDMSDLAKGDITSNLVQLNSEYKKWIDKQEVKANNELFGEFLTTANRHIESCRACLKRMIEGVELLKSNPNVNRAFKLMNRAMLLQQLNYSIQTRNWKEENGQIKVSKVMVEGREEGVHPNILEENTYPIRNGNLLVGSWRPFQIAFILINLHSMLDEKHPDRQMVDLIWFPTGGGKTEAYLGLSAFTIFLRKLKDKTDSGTSVMMRYTLRLLTAQQFQRAAALICACEKIREENKEELGIDRITIGLWVGELTPTKELMLRKHLRRCAREEKTIIHLLF
jgi:hypothetical protein